MNLPHLLGHFHWAHVLIALAPLILSTGLVNLGRSVNVLSGFQGVAAGGTASLNLPVGQRYHRNNIQCQAINYSASSSGVAQTPVIISSAGGAVGTGTITPTITTGTVTGFTLSAGTSSGFVAGDTITFKDPTGIGFVLKCNTNGALTTANWSILSGGIAGPIDPRLLITSIKQVVNGQVIRDISPTSIIGICNFFGYRPQYGTLPLLYTEPWANWLRDAELNSWDLVGQNTFQMQFGIAAGYGSPNLYGIMEFDKLRNMRTINASNQPYILQSNGSQYPIGTKVPFLAPVQQHQFTFTVNAGQTDITTVPFNYPIRAIYIAGATPNNIYGLDILADGALVLQTTGKDLAELNSQYNFQGSSPAYVPQASGGGGYAGYTVGTSGAQGQTPTTIPNGVLGSFDGNASAPYSFDAVYLAAMDSRQWKSLRVASSLIIRVRSVVQQNVTVVMEYLPGAYLG